MPKPVKQIPLFPTADSLSEAISIIESHLPISNKNTLHALLMMFRNTLIQQMEQDYANSEDTRNHQTI